MIDRERIRKGNARAVRNYNAWYGSLSRYDDLRNELNGTRKCYNSDMPNYRFASCRVDLLCLYWIVELDRLARNLAWLRNQHCCSCRQCNLHKRRFGGNSMTTIGIQEKRQLLRPLSLDEYDPLTPEPEPTEVKE